MSTETGRVEISFTSDSRLLAGVAGAVNHVAEAAGMSEDSRAEFVAAVEDACQEALAEASKEHTKVDLAVDLVGDKIEAVVEFHAAGKQGAGAASGKTVRRKLDVIRREANGDRTRVILAKKIS